MSRRLLPFTLYAPAAGFARCDGNKTIVAAIWRFVKPKTADFCRFLAFLPRRAACAARRDMVYYYTGQADVPPRPKKKGRPCADRKT